MYSVTNYLFLLNLDFMLLVNIFYIIYKSYLFCPNEHGQNYILGTTRAFKSCMVTNLYINHKNDEAFCKVRPN